MCVRNTLVFLALFGAIALLAFATPIILADATTDSPGFERYYEISKDRLPLKLLVSSNNDNLAPEDVARVQMNTYEKDPAGTKVMSVTYFVTLKDVPGNKTIFVDAFHGPNGTINFLLAHTTEERTTISGGQREQYLNAWIADADVKPDMLVVKSPDIRQGGISQLTFELFTLDDIRNIISQENIPKLDYLLDVDKDSHTEFAVVPEFPTGVLIMISGLFSIVALCSRFWPNSLSLWS